MFYFSADVIVADINHRTPPSYRVTTIPHYTPSLICSAIENISGNGRCLYLTIMTAIVCFGSVVVLPRGVIMMVVEAVVFVVVIEYELSGWQHDCSGCGSGNVLVSTAARLSRLSCRHHLVTPADEVRSTTLKK